MCSPAREFAIERATVVQKKTGRSVQFAITEQTRIAIGEWLAALSAPRGRYLSPSRFQAQPHCRPANTPIDGWRAPGSTAYGRHSLRPTKPAQIYEKTGNRRAVQLLLGYTKLESTVRYLGIEVDDALAISEQVDL
jgi:hypothetical protein